MRRMALRSRSQCCFIYLRSATRGGIKMQLLTCFLLFDLFLRRGRFSQLRYDSVSLHDTLKMQAIFDAHVSGMRHLRHHGPSLDWQVWVKSRESMFPQCAPCHENVYHACF
ncbi:hypothetical protein BDR04DRAFT_513529 [Suillus decipiens]|nr:hypothetical protein BDR04DRAFT_513529 [Suillus decipiens]